MLYMSFADVFGRHKLSAVVRKTSRVSDPGLLLCDEALDELIPFLLVGFDAFV